MTPKDDWAGVNVALGRVCTSVPELTVMDVYNSVSSITDSGVLAYLKSLVSGADAERAYAVQPVRRRLIGAIACVFTRLVPSSLGVLMAIDKMMSGARRQTQSC